MTRKSLLRTIFTGSGNGIPKLAYFSGLWQLCHSPVSAFKALSLKNLGNCTDMQGKTYAICLWKPEAKHSIIAGHKGTTRLFRLHYCVIGGIMQGVIRYIRKRERKRAADEDGRFILS